MTQPYDAIGRGYARLRRPDPRIAAAIEDALGDATSVLNVGAGTGSYESSGRTVVAVEPSLTMIGQRPVDSVAVVRAVASALPFAAGAFDAATAILTIHHWPDPVAGLRELRRVAAGPIVILTHEPVAGRFWLHDYVGALLDREQDLFLMPDDLGDLLGPVEVRPIPVPADCVDGFLGAYWRRPEAYLDSAVRSAISAFAKHDKAPAGLERLREDLRTGAWQRRYGHLLELPELDLGYKLVIAGP